MLSEIGLIGLGVMGKNIGLNISEKGTNIKAYNASTEKLDSIKKEVENSKKLFKKNSWPIIDVTRRSVEETAASILKIIEIKKNK